MATSLLLACGLNEQKLPSKIHLSEESDVDGSFLISSILGQRLRIQNSGVILICLQQTYEHYVNAGIRLGYNLNMFKGKNLYVFEPIQEILLSNMEEAQNIIPPAADTNDLTLSNKIYEYILNVLKENLIKKSPVTILLDNLSILLNLGETTNSILIFYQKLIELIDSNVDNCITLVTKLNNCELFNVFDNNLIRMSDLHLNIIKLKSGSFKEVDGRLIITREEILGYCQIVKLEKNILYKINDRNIKTFYPGEVGIKV